MKYTEELDSLFEQQDDLAEALHELTLISYIPVNTVDELRISHQNNNNARLRMIQILGAMITIESEIIRLSDVQASLEVDKYDLAAQEDERNYRIANEIEEMRLNLDVPEDQPASTIIQWSNK